MIFFYKIWLWEGVPGSHSHAKFHRCGFNGFKNVGLQPPKSPQLVFFGTNLPKMAVYNTSLSKTSRGFSVKAHLLVILTKESVQTRVFRASPQFFIKRRRSAVIAFLGGFPPNILTPPQKPHFGRFFNANQLQRERSVSPAWMELRSWKFTVI